MNATLHVKKFRSCLDKGNLDYKKKGISFPLLMGLLPFIFITILSILSSCMHESSEPDSREISKKSTQLHQRPNDKNELLFINQKFYDILLNTSEAGAVKLDKAFDALSIFEPILFGVYKAGINPITREKQIAPKDSSKAVYNIDNDYHFFYFFNHKGMFENEVPEKPYLIASKWYAADTVFYQTRDAISNAKLNKSPYFKKLAKDDSLVLLNGKFSMVNISHFLSKPHSLTENNAHDFFKDILNAITLELCADSLKRLYHPAQWWKADKNEITSVADEKGTKPILYEKYHPNSATQVKFQTQEISFISLTFFPKRTDREALKMTSLSNVYGVNQFFMDHDLTSGYVHPYTRNFFTKLDPEGFVMYFKRSPTHMNEAIAAYKRKKDLSSDDVLGRNFAFCRQWKLSEIDLSDQKILMKKCRFSSNCNCLQVKQSSMNPFRPEIPLWSTYKTEGYIDLQHLKGFGHTDGGTVVLIWENNQGEILFKDIHGSIYDIITAATHIRDKYQTDPVIGIYDAGPFARKFQSNAGVLDFAPVNSNTSYGSIVGAGYGYVME